MHSVSGLNYRAQVLQELMLTLDVVRKETAEFVSNAQTVDGIPTLCKRIRQVTRTLAMIELRGAALLSLELEKLLLSVADQTVRNESDATVALVRASEQLPEYLEYISHGSDDMPLALLPLLNDMRAVRGKRLLSEAMLLLPKFSGKKAPLPGSLDTKQEEQFLETLKRVRTPLVQGLLKWYRGKNVEASLREVHAALGLLKSVSFNGALSRLWRIARAVAQSLLDGGLEQNAAVKSLFGQIERFLQQLVQTNDKAIYQPVPNELFRNLLYYVALSESQDKDIVRLKQTYKLDEYLPNAALRSQALHALEGPDISMLRSVAENIRDELASLKTVVEIVAHSREPNPEHLETLPASLKKLSATLEMLGMHQVTPVAEELAKLIADTPHQPDLNKDVLLDIASETLKIEGALDEFLHSREQLLQSNTSNSNRPIADGSDDVSEFDELQASLLGETLRSLEQIKEHYLKALAGNRSNQQLTRAAEILAESAGALHILPMPEVALLLNDLAEYTVSVNTDEFEKVSSSNHARYADVISNLEVYLELHIQRRPALADLLACSADALEKLKSNNENLEEPTSQITSTTESEPTVVESASPEMLGVFIEEAMQQFHVISENMALLRSDEEDMSALERVRRAFHTLKGSGRMVGANVIGEFAWSVENLMNRVLAGSVTLDNAVHSLLDESVAAIPQLIDGLHGASEQVEGIDELKARAFSLAEKPVVLSNKKKPTLADLEAREKQAAASQTASETQALTDVTEIEVETGALTRPDNDDDPVLDMTQTLDVTGAIGSSETLQLPPMDQADTVEMNGLQTAENEQPVVRRLEDSSLELEQTAKEVTPAGFDPVLFGIFNTECTQHIATLKDILNRALSGDGKLQASEKMVRALHTLTGSAQTARVDAIASLLSPVEIAVKRKQRAGGRFSRGETLYLSEVVIALEDRLDAFREGRAEPQSVADVEARLESFTERVLAETDDIARAPRLGELQSVFLEEAQDLVEHLQGLMSHWKSNPRERSFIPDLQATLHTLKGSARVASYTGIADLAHAMEDAVQRWTDNAGPFDADVFDALDDAIGAIGINLEQAQSGEAPGYFDWLISELRSVRTDIKLEAGDEEVLPAVSSATQTEIKSTPATAKSVVEESVGKDEPVSARLRLDSAVIDRLTALSNEASVHHGQLGELHGSLTESLSELDQTVARLRQQLRELDIESDIQINSALPETTGAFDPLELDKYGRLQEISRGVLETFSDLDDIRYSLGVNLRHAEVELNEQTRLNISIQESLGQIRMVRFSSIVNRLQQTVLNAGASSGKSVRLSVEGVDSAIDRTVLKHLTSPLEHLLRNAVVHGVETNDKRDARNKSATAQLHVQMLIDEGDIVLTIRDDGAGVDVKKVRKKALEQGLIRKNARLTGGRLLDLLATPGFSTAQSLDQVAGRGIGLDAVRRELVKIGGVLSMQTAAGEGTTFSIRIPQAQFVNQVLLLTIDEGVFAIPANRVHGVSRIRASEANRFIQDPAIRVEFNGQACRCLNLDELMGAVSFPKQRLATQGTSALVHIAIAGESIALLVKTVPGHLETIVKPAGEQITRLGGFSGACVRSNGQVIPMLDLTTLLERYLDRLEEAVESKAITDNTHTVAPANRLRVMVVDDSITMRKYAERALLRDNYLPVLARDGVEAMALMKREKPDLVLTDLEMPHMDGFELVAMIRNDASLKDLPLIVISSRSGVKHRERLEKSGIQGFLGKPYQENELLQLVKTVQSS